MRINIRVGPPPQSFDPSAVAASKTDSKSGLTASEELIAELIKDGIDPQLLSKQLQINDESDASSYIGSTEIAFEKELSDQDLSLVKVTGKSWTLFRAVGTF